MIKIQNITKSFNSKNKTFKALDNVSLEIEAGEIFGIIGYSGAGKSTLIRLINQLEKADEGNIFIDEIDVTKVSKKELLKLRQNIGMIFQHFNLLWSKTVIKNIALPLEIAHLNKNKRLEKAKELATLVGLKDKLNEYPSSLSGGQKQRVAIARALASNPKIILCDEATSALDPETTASILTLLKEINQKYNITIVMITHQLEVVSRICHKMAVMSNGKIVEQGPVEEIFRKPKHQVTKQFIDQVDKLNNVIESEIELRKNYQKGSLLKLKFTSDTTGKPILFNLGFKHQLEFNIVSADIVHTINGPLGTMYVHINKDHSLLENFIFDLKTQNIEVEVLSKND